MRTPQQLQTTVTYSYDLWCYQVTTLLAFILCVDVDGLLTCPIRSNIEEVMFIQTLAILGATPRSLLSQSNVLRKHPIQIAISLSSNLQLRCFWAFCNLDVISYLLLMALPSWLLVSVGGRHLQCPGPSPILGSLGPSHQWRQVGQDLASPPCDWTLLNNGKPSRSCNRYNLVKALRSGLIVSS